VKASFKLPTGTSISVRPYTTLPLRRFCDVSIAYVGVYECQHAFVRRYLCYLHKNMLQKMT